MKIRILESASQFLIDGFHFYEKQAIGLGNYFLDGLFSDVDSLQVYARIHPIYFDTYYRMLSKRFPFAIYYRVVDDEALIYAILDCRKSPAWIRKQLNKA